MATIFDKDVVTLPQKRYEDLIQTETKYLQLFQYQHEHGNDDVLRLIDKEKFNNEYEKVEEEN